MSIGTNVSLGPVKFSSQIKNSKLWLNSNGGNIPLSELF